MASSVNQTVRLPRWRRAGVVLGPVRHPVPLLRDAVTASGIGFEGHGRDLWSEAEQASTLSSRGYQLAHPCNKAF